MKEIKRNWWFTELYNSITKNIQGALLTKSRKIYNLNSVIDFNFESVEENDVDDDNNYSKFDIEFNSKVLSLVNNEDINYVSFKISNFENQIRDEFLEKVFITDNKLQDVIDLWNNKVSEDFITRYLLERFKIDIFLTLKNFDSFDCDCRKFSKSGKICEHIVASILTFIDEINYNPQILFDLIGFTRKEIRNKMFFNSSKEDNGFVFSDFLQFPFFLNYENGFIDDKSNSTFSDNDKIVFYNNISEIKDYYGNDKNEYMKAISKDIRNNIQLKSKDNRSPEIYNYVDKIDSVYYNTINYIKAVISKKK